MIEKLNHYFMLDELHTTVPREMLAGFTTFISMAYIMFVNPSVLGAAGVDKGAVFTATALASAIGCILMGVLARYPIATAPALGINAFFCLLGCYRNESSVADGNGWSVCSFADFLGNYNL